MQVTIKTIKLTLKIFNQLPTISAVEFQDLAWSVLGFVSIKGVTHFILKNGDIHATIPTKMWSVVPRIGWVKSGCPEWGVSYVGCKSGEGIEFYSKGEALAFISSKRDTSTPMSLQIFI